MPALPWPLSVLSARPGAFFQSTHTSRFSLRATHTSAALDELHGASERAAKDERDSRGRERQHFDL